jgi:hypothetical protein
MNAEEMNEIKNSIKASQPSKGTNPLAITSYTEDDFDIDTILTGMGKSAKKTARTKAGTPRKAETGFTISREHKIAAIKVFIAVMAFIIGILLYSLLDTFINRHQPHIHRNIITAPRNP